MDAIGDLLRRPLTALPHELLLDQLIATFGGQAASWTWRYKGESQGAVFWPGGLRPDKQDWPLMQQIVEHHPFARWHNLTAECTPQTMARITRRIPMTNPPEMWLDLMKKYGTDQLSIPLHVTRGRYRAYVLVDSRSDDWPAEDLEFARRLQPLLIGLERQATALARGGVPPNVVGLMDEVRLTSRELAVLRVLGSGCTAQQMAHRLGMAPRTAQKHLEHIYAKLQVSDRLSAVLKAQQLGLLPIAIRNDAASRQ